GTGRAEEPTEVRHTVVLAQPLVWVGQVGASVEHAVGTHVALSGGVQVGALLNDNRTTTDGRGGFSGQNWSLGVDPGVHFYLAGRAPEGLWVGPHLEASVEHQSFASEAAQLDGSFQTFQTGSRRVQYGGSARAGYTAILAPGLSVQVGVGLAVLGVSYRNFTSNAPVQALTPDQHGWRLNPRMTVGLGWAF
ncbi:MAG: hypothetical protein ACXU86_16220, partial [Archangium sp.]